MQRVVADIGNSGGTAHGIVADIGSLEGVQMVVEGAVEQFGAIDVLVHNAGILPLQSMDIAHAMLYLASEGASYVTGQTIIVNGGAILPENGALMM